MTVTLKDIAENLNLSVSLVSKVLSGRMGTTGANPQVAQAIRLRAEELGYHPNRTAQALSSGVHGLIAVFIHNIGVAGSGLVESLIRGIAEAASHSQQRLWLNFFQTDEDFLRQCPEAHAGHVDGVIIAGVPHSELISDLLVRHSAGVPVVTIHDNIIDPRLVNVGCDQVQVTRLATEHLINQGCRQLAHIHFDQERFAGFESTLKAQQLPMDPKLICHVDGYTYDAGQHAAKQLLASGRPFDGIVAQSDVQALGALHYLQAHGRTAPDTLRIIGVDNSPLCECAIVPLSSVSQNYDQRGQQAVQSLLDLMAGRPTQSTTVTPTLHPRRSTQ